MLNNYIPIFIFIGISFIFGIIPIILNKIVAPNEYNEVKESQYECGFPPFQNARLKFNIKFYLVAILFIIFDLEITFLFPWAVIINYLGIYSFISMLIFLLILTVGFLFEWNKGALEWE